MALDGWQRPQLARAPAWTLPELLLATGLVVLVGAWLMRGGTEAMARQRLQTASQRLVSGLEDARAAALREGHPCAMRLGLSGWEAPLGNQLPACAGVAPGLDAAVAVSHNLPDPMRFSANGLVLDGGTVWLRSQGTALVRCVVVSLPLGVTRVGREGPSGCEPESVQ